MTITGTAFTGATAVKFGGLTASFTVRSSTQIEATVPNGALAGDDLGHDAGEDGHEQHQVHADAVGVVVLPQEGRGRRGRDDRRESASTAAHR